MRILVTGGSGMVGSAIKRNIEDKHDYSFISSNDCDLSKIESVELLFRTYTPDCVIHLAACVGGLFKNMNNKVEMLEKNVLINFNVIKSCHKYKVKKCISCLSTCIFPDKTTYPIDETMLHNGPPHSSNDAYAYAKRLLEIHSKAYRENFNKDFVCIIPTNIYGINDNFNLEDGHVIPSLIHKCFLAKKNNTDFVVKGSGKPLRQFIYSDDLAKIILKILFCDKKIDNLIVSVPPKDEISIKDVAFNISKKFNYTERLVFNPNYSDGQYKKTADNAKLMKLINFKFTDINIGLNETIEWFEKNYNNNIRI